MECKGVYIIAISILLWACKEDKCKGKEYYPVDPRVIEAIPYVDKQLVAFRTNRGDNFYAGVKRVFGIDNSQFMCDEGLTVTLNTGDMRPYMEFVHLGTSDAPFIQILISPDRNNVAQAVQILLTEDGKMAEYLPNPYKKPVYYNTISIAGKSYADVVEIALIKPYPKSIVQLFYNKAFGVIQFTTEDGLVVTREG